MQQKDHYKVEVWLNGSFYDKFAVDVNNNYDPAKIIEQIRSRIADGTAPFADRIEIRKARI